jgi:hypothetical protein
MGFGQGATCDYLNRKLHSTRRNFTARRGLDTGSVSQFLPYARQRMPLIPMSPFGIGHKSDISLRRKVPCVDGSELARRIFTSRCWSVQPCVRPVSAVHMTAGHNALRGSGPGQKPAFENAMAHVGCPDRQINRLCITCCSPSQPSHHAGCRRDLITPQARRVPCSTHLWPSWPKPSSPACWRARPRRPSLAAAPTMR